MIYQLFDYKDFSPHELLKSTRYKYIPYEKSISIIIKYFKMRKKGRQLNY